TDSDTNPGFWTTRLAGSGSTAAEPVGGPVALTASGSQYPHAQLASNTQPMFNFFHTPILIQGSGLNFTSPDTGGNKTLLRLAVSSRTLLNNDDSEYLCDDAFALRIESYSTATGSSNFAMGVKQNYPSHNTEYDGYLLVKPINSGNAAML